MRKLIFFGVGLLLTSALFARDPEDSVKMMLEYKRQLDSIENSLHYKSGKVSLVGGTVEFNIPPQFKFLDSADARYVVEELWGNPPSSETLGLLVPANIGVFDDGYAFIVSYDGMGYVKDDDASKIDYDDLLKDLKKGSGESNAERKKLNLPTMELLGWASKPYYDENKKVLHWAKEYRVQDAEQHTLNYDVRVLGRKGVLILQAVAGINQLDSVNAHIGDVLGMVSFSEGNRYKDFDSGTDNVAAWTIGGLVAGKVLAKVGFFAIILKYLKLIIIGLGVAGGAIWRFVTGRKKKKEEELAYQPAPVAEPVDGTNPPA